MPAFKSRIQRVQEKFSERLLHLGGLAFFTPLRWYDEHQVSRALDEQLVSLLKNSDASAEVTFACELLFLRYRDRTIAAGNVDGLRLERLIQQHPQDRYTVVDRYIQPSPETESGAHAADRAVQYTITLYDAQFLGADGFARAGVRLTFDPRHGHRLFAQSFTRHRDTLGDALCADPAANLQCACRSIDYGTAAVPDAGTVTRLLETEEPLLSGPPPRDEASTPS
jgi:hypothetical protein